MTIRPVSLQSQSSSSTAVVSEFLAAALDTEFNASTLRKTYQSHFRALLKLELDPIDYSELERVLQLAEDSFRTNRHQTIRESLEAVESQEVTFLEIRGTRSPSFVDFGDEPSRWVDQGIAEAGIVEVLAQQRAPLSTLLALAAGAECAPTEAWLAAGGTVLAVMRPNPQRWAELIAFTRASAGKLIVPIKGAASKSLSDHEIAARAGIDLVQDFEFLPTILSHAIYSRHTVIGAYAYSPGASHLVVQAVQDAFIDYAAKHYTSEQVAFHWLATPTDSQVLPNEFINYAHNRYENRSIHVKLRDYVWKIFGQVRSPKTLRTNEFVVVDSSVKKQGFNYQFAKRTQRLRALLLHSKGFSVSYGVTPPATTDSVLSHRILIASYRGAPRFGLHPFDKDLIGPIAMQQCLHSLSMHASKPHEVYAKFAVHGGLWRLGYDPQTVWIPATISGLLGLILPRNRAFRSVSLTKR